MKKAVLPLFLLLLVAACGDNVKATSSSGFKNTNEVLSTRMKVGFALDDVIVNPAPLYRMAESLGLTNGSDAWWSFVNQNDWRYSRLKVKTLLLIKSEAAKGSRLFVIISGRKPVEGSKLANWLETVTGIPAPSVYFENGNKAARMVDLKLDVFYGMTDQDIEEALASGVKPIRILRSAESADKRKYNPGAYLEEIVPDSAE